MFSGRIVKRDILAGANASECLSALYVSSCLKVIRGEGAKKTAVVAKKTHLQRKKKYFPGYFEKSWERVNKNKMEALLSVSFYLTQFYFTQLQVLLFLSLVGW